MQNVRVDWKKVESKDWIKYRFDFVKDYDLSPVDMVVYGYIYRHCSQYSEADNADYWLGESDKTISENCLIPERTIRTSLKTLREKGLIFVNGSGTKLRRITLNDAIFVKEVQMDMDKLENDNLQLEITKLRKRIAELEEIKQPDYSVYTFDLFKKGIVKDDEKTRKLINDQIGPLYWSFVVKEPWGSIGLLKAHFSRLEMYKDGEIENPVAYLRTAFEQFSYQVMRSHTSENPFLEE